MKSKKNNKQLVHDRLEKQFDEELILHENQVFQNEKDRTDGTIENKHITSYLSDKGIMAISYVELLNQILEQNPPSNLGDIIYLKPQAISSLDFNIKFQIFLNR